MEPSLTEISVLLDYLSQLLTQIYQSRFTENMMLKKHVVCNLHHPHIDKATYSQTSYVLM